MASEGKIDEGVDGEAALELKQDEKENKSAGSKDGKVKKEEDKESEDDKLGETEGAYLIKLYHARGNRPAVKLILENQSLPEDLPPRYDAVKRRLAPFLNSVPSQENKYSLLPIWKLVSTIDDLQTLVYVVHNMRTKAITIFYYTDYVCTYERLNQKMLRKMYLCVHPKYFENHYLEMRSLAVTGCPVNANTAIGWMTESIHTEKEMYVREDELCAVSVTKELDGMPLIVLYLLIRKCMVKLYKYTTVSLNTLVMVALLKDEGNKAAYDFTAINDEQSLSEMSCLCEGLYKELDSDWKKYAKAIYKKCKKRESNPDLATELYEAVKHCKLPDLTELELSPYDGTDGFGYLYSDQTIKEMKKKKEKKTVKSTKEESEQKDKKKAKENKRWSDSSDSSDNDEGDDDDTSGSGSDDDVSSKNGEKGLGEYSSSSSDQPSYNWGKGKGGWKRSGKGNYSYGKGGWNWQSDKPSTYKQLHSGPGDYDEDGHLRPGSANRIVASKAMYQRLTYHFKCQWTTLEDLYKSINKQRYSIDMLREIAKHETFKSGLPIYELRGDFVRSLPGNDK